MALNISLLWFMIFIFASGTKLTKEEGKNLRSYEIVTLDSSNFTTFVTLNNNVYVYFKSEAKLAKNISDELDLTIKVLNITKLDVIVAVLNIENSLELQEDLNIDSSTKFRLYTKINRYYNLPEIADFDHKIFWIDDILKLSKNELVNSQELEEYINNNSCYTLYIGSLTSKNRK